MIQMLSNRRKTLFRWIKWSLILLFVLVLFLGWWVWQRSYPFLALSRPVENPDIAIVEGWLPYRALKVVYEESQSQPDLKLLVTGSGRGHSYFTLGGHPQSTWISYIDQQFDFPCRADSLHLRAWGNEVDEEKGHLEILINDQVLAEFYTERRGKKFSFAIPSHLRQSIKKLTVHMDNTNVSEGGRVRRTFFNEVSLDTLSVPLFSDHTSYVFIFANEERFETPQNENSAIYAGRTLERMGVHPSRLVILPSKAENRSRTLGAAKEVETWLIESQEECNTIMLYSQGAHARRSYEMFRKTLPDSIQLGVVALRDYRYDENWTSTARGRRLMIEQIVKYFLSKVFIF
ncbi:MAG: hypothetical protein AAF694_10295 [Bacteroidota bacterium]